MTKMDPDNEATFDNCVIPSDLKEAGNLKRAIFVELDRCQFGEEEQFGIKLALEEALTNAVKHGSCHDKSKPITVRYSVTTERAVFIIRDEGPGFDPIDVPDCTAPERIPFPSGRGIMLIRAYMDEVCYRDNGREIYFRKRRGPHTSSHA